MELGPDIAFVANLMGEPARAAILVALVGGRARPAGELAFIGNVAPQTASFHLRKLMEAALITVERHGRHSYYRLADERVAATLESLAALAPVRQPATPQTRADSERIRELRLARSCYKHLAGKLAVEIHRAWTDRGLLAADYSLTQAGERWCRELGFPPLARLTGKACLDWTERRHHIGGALGAAVFSRLLDLNWIARNPQTRAVRITYTGARAFEQKLGITIPGY